MASIKTPMLPILIATLFPVSVLAQSESEAPAKSARQIEEVVVTASRREQSIQDVAGGIQVFTGNQLEKEGADGFDDYVIKVPGVGFRKDGGGGTKLGIRGVSNVGGNISGLFSSVSAVGLYINDVPMQGSGTLPDLGLYDLNRVEVLKGPQGTLYGEGSMGGAIKMIVNAPSLVEYDLKAEIGIAKTTGAQDNNYTYKLAGGGPLIEEKVGLRLVATAKQEAGYIDFPNVEGEDANDSKGDNLRASVLWQVNDKLSAEFLYLNDYAYADAPANEDQNKSTRFENQNFEDEFYDVDFTLTGLTVNYAFESIDLTSVTSFLEIDKKQVYRFGLTQGTLSSGGLNNGTNTGGEPLPLIDPVLGAVNPYDNVRNEPYNVASAQKGVAQELRLVSNSDGNFSWIAGFFYRDRIQEYETTLFQPDLASRIPISIPTNPVTRWDPSDPRGLTRDGDEGAEQYALYFESTLRFLERFELTTGLRYFEETITAFDKTVFYNDYVLIYEAAGTDGKFAESYEQETNDYLPKASLTWYITDEHMVYALASRGFRSGAANVQRVFELGPEIIQPDFTWNYEIGTKTSWFDGSLIVNASAFFIDWSDIQAQRKGQITIGSVQADSAYFDNAGDAEVKGAEIDVLWVTPIEGLMTGVSLGYNDGILVSVPEDSTAVEGSRLPNMPETTGNIFANYTTQLWGSILGNVGLSMQYVDDQGTLVVSTDESPEGSPTDAYTNLKLTLGVEGYNWGLTFTADNLQNKRQEIAVYDFYGDQYTTLGRPKTIGVNLRFNF